MINKSYFSHPLKRCHVDDDFSSRKVHAKNRVSLEFDVQPRVVVRRHWSLALKGQLEYPVEQLAIAEGKPAAFFPSYEAGLFSGLTNCLRIIYVKCFTEWIHTAERKCMGMMLQISARSGFAAADSASCFG